MELWKGGKRVSVKCIPPEDLPPEAQPVCHAIHQAKAHMVREAGVLGADLVIVLRGVSAEFFLGPTVKACLLAGARVYACAHNKVAHMAPHRLRTEQAFFKVCRAFNPGACAAFARIWAALSAHAALPAAQGAAQQVGQGLGFAASWGAVFELRMRGVLAEKHPGLYQEWVGAGLPPIRDFLAEHAPDVLEEAGKQQAAHLNTPEGRARSAERLRQRHARDREAKQKGVPEGSKVCSRWDKGNGTCTEPYKLLEDFAKDSRKPSGLGPACKDCVNAVRPRTVHVHELLQVPHVQN